MSSKSSSQLASSEMSPTQNSGETNSEEPATLTSTLPVEPTHSPDPHDSEHEANTPTGIYCFSIYSWHDYVVTRSGYTLNASSMNSTRLGSFLIGNLVDNKNH